MTVKLKRRPKVKRAHHVLFLAAAVVLLSNNHVAHATDISGPTISSTVTITSDSRLTADIKCAVTGAPCIQFGAPGIKLKLNGHIMAGNGLRDACTFSGGEDGIFTNGKNNVSIEGPGIVRRFQQRGIDVTGNNSIVKHVTVLSSCLEGILVGGSHNVVVDNSVARASLGAPFQASIWVQGTGSHVIRRNEISAAGQIGGSGQGIFVGSFIGPTPSTNNVIEENSSSGIPGSGLFFTPGSIGNEVEKNQFLGNLINEDIFDDNPVGANNYEDNLCEVSTFVPSTSTNVCEIPNIAGHKNPGEDD
jgi:hypothetical protein